MAADPVFSRRWIQTPSAVVAEPRSTRGRVVLGASPGAAKRFGVQRHADIPFAAMSQAKFDDLRTRLAEIADLVKTAALLGWDQHVMMPPRGAGIRAEQFATIGRIAHQKFTDASMGTLLDDLRSWGEQH